jgi:hypothetical protein
LFREGEVRTFRPCHASASGSRVPRGGAGAGRPARPLRSRIRSREPWTRVVKHAGPRGPAAAADADRSVPPDRRGCRRGGRKREAPRLHVGEAGRSILRSARSGAGDYSRIGPPPTSRTVSCPSHPPPTVDTVVPPIRPLPSVPLDRLPKAGTMVP